MGTEKYNKIFLKGLSLNLSHTQFQKYLEINQRVKIVRNRWKGIKKIISLSNSNYAFQNALAVNIEPITLPSDIANNDLLKTY